MGAFRCTCRASTRRLKSSSSGEEAALALAVEEAHANGAGARRLRVSIPSHCPLMDVVSTRLREAMHSPRLLYVRNHRARIAGEAAEVREDLILNVSRTVRWHDSLTLLYELGCRLFVESPPGEVLSNLVKASFPEARTLALNDAPLAMGCHAGAAARLRIAVTIRAITGSRSSTVRPDCESGNLMASTACGRSIWEVGLLVGFDQRR